MNNKKQTAVEWYAGRVHDIERCLKLGIISTIDYYEQLTKAVKQAKEMEKEQIMNAFSMGIGNANRMEATKDAEQWYNETYGGNNGRSS
jgi:1,4-dihydroxy-2-naphthoyl-CoA synthase